MQTTQTEREAERRWRDHYNRTARAYDRKEMLWGLLLGYWDPMERQRLILRLRVEPGQRLLEVATGTGANLLAAAEVLGPEGSMVGSDISEEMLRVCRHKLSSEGERAGLVTSDAAHLPFASESFDAVLHFGAIRMFSDRGAAIEELVRVAKPGGRILIGDVGLHPGKRHTIRGRLLLRFAPHYASLPPKEFPLGMKEVHSSFLKADTCYLLDFTKP